MVRACHGGTDIDGDVPGGIDGASENDIDQGSINENGMALASCWRSVAVIKRRVIVVYGRCVSSKI